jgi:aminoglycoside phosphotransferase (APT) family kinase protein
VIVTGSARAWWDRRRQRLALRELRPSIASAAAMALGEDSAEYAIERLQLTSTAVAVAVVAPLDGGARAVLKMPMTAEALVGFDAESRVLAGLYEDDRLGDWVRFVPRPLASGILDGRRFRVDSWVPGEPALEKLARDPTATDRLLDVAAATIHELHSRTATHVEADDALVKNWIDNHVRVLMVGADRVPGAAAALQRVRQELQEAVEERVFWAGTVHGDYWFGNLLVSGPEPTGIVDWDAGGTAELPAIDVLHLVLLTRCLTSRRGLGEFVSDQLVHPDWSARERRLLERYGGLGTEGSLSDRHVLLLYWLRYAARQRRQSLQGTGLEEAIWERRNVRRVLEAA